MTRYRSEKYKAWVRQQPCCICEAPGPNEAHHIRGIGSLGGAGLKAPDTALMPLCSKHHRDMHVFPDMWADQWEFAWRTISKAIHEGFKF